MILNMDPVTREELFLAAAAGEDVTLPEPVTRTEMFLAAAAGMEVTIPTPVTRKEIFLNRIAENAGNSSSGSDSANGAMFDHLRWIDDIAYGVGENREYCYNAWCPNNVAYDETRGVLVFLQTHTSSHANGTQDRTLCTHDPFAPAIHTMVENFPAFVSKEGVGGLVIKDGVWKVYSLKRILTSSDGGETWSEEAVITAPGRMFGVWEIDNVLYTGDDSGANDGVYYISDDGGLNWETKTFDFVSDYAGELTCSEAHFCKYNGALYAALRRADKWGILAKCVNGVWEVVLDNLRNDSSDAHLSVYGNEMVIAAIDRIKLRLHIGVYDGNTVTWKRDFNFSEMTCSGDFHTPTFVYGNGFAAIFFMTGIGYGNSGYSHCINAALWAYTENQEYQLPEYEYQPLTLWAEDIADSPATGTVTTADNGNKTIVVNAYYSITKRIAGTFPPNSDGTVSLYSITPHLFLPRIGTSTSTSYAAWDMKEIDGVKYACFGKGGVARPNMRLMGLALETVINDVDMSGATYVFRNSANATIYAEANGVYRNVTWVAG